MNIAINIPTTSTEIVRYLQSGKFLCRNHPDFDHRSMYDECSSHEQGMKKLLECTGATLLGGDDDGFYYLGDPTDNSESDSAQRIVKLKEYKDHLTLYILLHKVIQNITPGTDFFLADIEKKILGNMSLSATLGKEKETVRNALSKAIRKYVKDGFLYCADTKSEQYVFLSSFVFLRVMFDEIDIENLSVVQNEMQEEIERKNKEDETDKEDEINQPNDEETEGEYND